jgi:RNA polymerase sigma factor (sigma-70 family)
VPEGAALPDGALAGAHAVAFAPYDEPGKFPASQGGAKVEVMDFEAFVRAERSALVWFVMSHGASEHEANDIVQAAFVEAWKKWNTITSPRAWLRTVASRMYWRSTPLQQKQKNTDILVGEIPEQPEPGSAVDGVELEEQERWVTAVLAELPPRQRQVMALRYDGYSTQEIADLLDVEASAVRHNTLRAKSRLRYLRARAQEAAG